MASFLVGYLDIVYFFYGLSFIIMAVIIFSQLMIVRKSEFKLLDALWLLAWFGAIHGANEFIEMFAIIRGQALIFKILGPVFLIASFFFLFCFGYRLINSGKKKVVGIQFMILAVALLLIVVFFTGVTNEVAWLNSGRYFLGFPGGLMSAFGFVLYYRNNYKELNKLRVRKYFLLSASFFFVYALIGGLIVRKADFFPASVINLETFVYWLRVPAQCFRAACALGIAFSVWNIMGIFAAEETENIKKTEEAKRLSETGTLAITIAHELRNPLSAINMAAFNIKRKAQNPLLGTHLDTIERKIVQCNRIINNLLFYSRLGPPDYEKVNIHDILVECIVNAQNQFEKRITIEKGLNSIKDILVDADPTQITEIFCNMLNNAYDAVPEDKARIEVRAEVDKKHIKICIKDNGRGISKEVLGRIFDPFFSTKAKGIGLGLTVCRQMINMHGGTIRVDSEPEKGTAVTVTLPRKKE